MSRSSGDYHPSFYRRATSPRGAVVLGSAILVGALSSGCSSSTSSAAECPPGARSTTPYFFEVPGLISTANVEALVKGDAGAWEGVNNAVQSEKDMEAVPSNVNYTVYANVAYGDGLTEAKAEADAASLAEDTASKYGYTADTQLSEAYRAGNDQGAGTIYFDPMAVCVSITQRPSA